MKFKKSIKNFIGISLSFVILITLSGCTNVSKVTSNGNVNNLKQAQSDCTDHSECISGVCDHYKADMGKCAATLCKEGEKSDNNNFYCEKNGKWRKSKITGDNCTQDYECFKPTCFMNPSCDVSGISNTIVSCNKDNLCVSDDGMDECELQGLKKVLQKDQYMKTADGSCFESIAQMVLPTVCVNCPNGICEEEESKCNCPEDCK